MLQNRTLLVIALSLACAPIGLARQGAIPGFRADRIEAQHQREAALQEAVDPARLRAWHDLLGSEPHRAGTDGDLRQIERIAGAFKDMGLSVETHWFEAYLCSPISAALRITAPEEVELSITEPILASDPDTASPDLDIAWNAYSGSGVAEGGVVFANYGRLEDFEKLKSAGVEIAGKIVIARYGGNFRGYKAKYAEQAGAIGLIIYTDPADHGIDAGEHQHGTDPSETSPTPDQVQRGSILTLDYVGDPLTPNAPADEQAKRKEPSEVALPTIPVQPIGWRSAHEILSRMTGDAVPADWVRWTGGLPVTYRLTGGDELVVRLEVHQERKLVRTANVVATLAGSRFPKQEVIIGAHHDAWGYGAVDPLAGTILVMETARIIAERAKAGGEGARPARTIQFAAWGAEEFGIIGSTEWAEQHYTDLAEDAVAYINLDAAVTGPNFWAAAAPSLKQMVVESAKSVKQCNAEGSVYDAWLARAGEGATEPGVGSLGGGSDHVALYCVAGVPSIAMGSGGAKGSSYHSNYDTLAWYRAHVGDDYEPAAMVTRIVALTADRLANADVLPYDASRYARDLRAYLDVTRPLADARTMTFNPTQLNEAIDELESSATALNGAIAQALSAGATPQVALDRLSTELIGLERSWLRSRGLPERPWYRSQYVAPDPTSGYSAWMLPGLRWAVEEGTQQDIDEHLTVLRHIVKRLATRCAQMRAIIEN
ncbi:MAG: M28 family peptidase [Phycisphaerales bacterium]|nr:M28 family peptidase [Phycisphaerales bacterium]